MKEKEVNIPWFTQRTKTPRTDLHCSRRHGAPSPGALESPGRGVSSKGLLEGERARKKERHGDPSLWCRKGCFNDISVSIFRLLYKEFLSAVIKMRKPNVQQVLPREQGINSGHKDRKQSISQERGF